MHCQYCGLINGEDDHRCLRCGRRIAGIAIAAPTSYIGATALAVAAMPAREQDPATAARAESLEQPQLFQTPKAPAQKIIPFEQLQRQAAGRYAPPQPATPESTPARKPSAPARAKKTAHRRARQVSIFIPIFHRSAFWPPACRRRFMATVAWRLP